MFFSPKKLLHFSKERKILNAWKLIISFSAIVIIGIAIVVWASLNIMSSSILDHTRENSKELVKQTAKNIETILGQIDDYAMTVSRDDELATLVIKHDSIQKGDEKVQNLKRIDEMLSNYCKTREEIDYISIITRENTHIINGYQQKLLDDVSVLGFDVKSFREGNKKSLWYNTHESEIDPMFSGSDNSRVFSIVKGIYSISTLKSQEIILINIKESYLHSLIADIKFLDRSNIFIIDGSGKYVMNTQDTQLNGQAVEYDFTNEIIEKKRGEDIKEIDGDDYLVTYNTISEINGTKLEWTVVDITPVTSIIKGITEAVEYILIVGVLCIVFGLGISILITRYYNSNLDKRYDEKHSILIERERLASLGQLIGGIAHNLKTPIMSIAGGLEAISDLIDEYDNSIGDKEVTVEDHHEIAADILDWVEKIKPYCAYMSDVISAVKGQTTSVKDSATLTFTVGELIKRIKILMNHELKKNRCELNISVKVSEDTKILGEINNLVQIVNNLISNSIEAYNGEEGKIDLLIGTSGSNVEIVVKDYGCGIPDRIKEKLLKTMITTKGKNGTGLGLYMSYSTIRGKFRGDMHIESEEGKGTSINIIIPMI